MGSQVTLDQLTFRAPTTDDLQRTHALVTRCDVRDYGEPDTPLEYLAADWDRTDLARDAWLAVTPAGELAGYAAAKRWRNEVEYDLYVDPAWDGTDLARALLGHTIARGQAIAAELGTDVVARAYVAPTNGQMAEIVQEAGFYLAKHHFQMGIDLDAPPTAPIWPEGATVRTAVPGQDEPEIHALVEAAFARPGRTATTLDEWKRWMVHTDLYNPELWFLAVVEERLVGVCLSLAYPTEGWVRQLAVDEGWRRKGLGRALLHHAFGVFREMGYHQAGLAVDGENLDAQAFYQRVGMRCVRQHDEYACKIEKM
jgi:ribosomal protein S18 acetylase RimI-like enzyme